jgi:hypothetical protein
MTDQKTSENQDDLLKDLKQIVQETLGSPEDYQPLLESLTIYIVSRDHKVMTHGFNVGKKYRDKEDLRTIADSDHS